jgi:hypothetical protein
MKASSRSLFELTNLPSITLQKEPSLKRTTSVNEYSTLATSVAESNNIRVVSIKRDHLKFQSNQHDHVGLIKQRK